MVMNDLHHTWPISWRGSAAIHAATFYTNGTWPFGVMEIVSGRIEVKAMRRKISFSPGNVVELRMFRLPFPTMEAVFRDGKGHALVTFSVLRYGRLKILLEEAEFKISSEVNVYTGWDMAERAEKYGLLQSGGD
jgi:hypothetical protein